MSVVTITKQSHKDPAKFRVKFEDSKAVIGPGHEVRKNEKLPVIETASNVAIIGGGFSGIASAMRCVDKLKETDFVIFEKYDNFGGTWYANTYPGCASDIPALWYSFSNELNTSWSEAQPPQYEMEEYILEVVKKHDLRKYAKFQTCVTSAKYNESSGDWLLEATNIVTGQTYKHTSKIVLSCQGGLVHPNQLKAPGLDTFKGVYMHSAIWDHTVDFKGKKVVVVGNGCSANQCIPLLVRDYGVESLTQISRSGQYIMPPIPTGLQKMYQWLSFSRITLLMLRFVVFCVSESHFPLFKGANIIPRISRAMNKRTSINYMNKKCPEKFKDVIMPDFKIGCKRLIFDHDYMDTLSNPKMNVVGGSIKQVNEHSITMANGEVLEADIIIACTGYNVLKSFFYYDIIGRNNVDLKKVWEKEGVSAYNTLLVKDCPNFLLIGGPNATTGHSSDVMAIENGLNYFADIAPKVLNGTMKSFCVKTEKYNAWFKEIQAELARSVFGSPFGGCQSWYAEGNVNFLAYPYSQIDYWRRTRKANLSDLDIEPGSRHSKND